MKDTNNFIIQWTTLLQRPGTKMKNAGSHMYLPVKFVTLILIANKLSHKNILRFSCLHLKKVKTIF